MQEELVLAESDFFFSPAVSRAYVEINHTFLHTCTCDKLYTISLSKGIGSQTEGWVPWGLRSYCQEDS